MSANTAQPGIRTPLAWVTREDAAPAKPAAAAAGGALDGRRGEPLAEEAFRHVLAIERARADRAGRPLRLLAVSLNHGNRQPLSPEVASRIFGALTDAVRETDVVGWQREHHVAAAVLIDRADAPEAHVARVLIDRVTRVLEARLSPGVARQIKVQVVKARE